MKFFRYTHADGNSRFSSAHKFKHWTTVNTPPGMWVVHLLDHSKGMDFIEVVAAANEYEEQFREPKSSQETIALGLILLLQDALIRIE